MGQRLKDREEKCNRDLRGTFSLLGYTEQATREGCRCRSNVNDYKGIQPGSWLEKKLREIGCNAGGNWDLPGEASWSAWTSWTKRPVYMLCCSMNPELNLIIWQTG